MMKRILFFSIFVYVPMISALLPTVSLMNDILQGNKQAVEIYFEKGGKTDVRLTDDDDTLLQVTIRGLIRAQERYRNGLYACAGVATTSLIAFCYTEHKWLSLGISGSTIVFNFLYKKVHEATLREYMDIAEYLIARLPSTVVHARNKARPAQTALSMVQTAAFEHSNSFDKDFLSMMTRLEKLILEKK